MTELTVTTNVGKNYVNVVNDGGITFLIWPAEMTIRRSPDCPCLLVELNGIVREVSHDGNDSSLKIVSIDGTVPETLDALQTLLADLKG